MARSTIVVDLGYGDAGKGSVVDALSRRLPSLVVRYNGGPQAAHNVVTPNIGMHHTFAQFGAGTFAGARTYLSQYMLVNPISLLAEADHLLDLGQSDVMDRLTIHEDALVITPYHKVLNRIRETARGVHRHGSTGHGVGEAVKMSLDQPFLTLRAWSVTEPRLEAAREYLRQQCLEIDPDSPLLAYFDDRRVFGDTLAAAKEVFDGRLVDDMWFVKEQRKNIDVVYEGAQGVLLDEWHGFHPYTTWSTTTPENALSLCSTEPDEVIGILRSYMTRHGAGPFVTEAELGPDYDEPHNGYGEWQGGWRVGYPDLVAAKYAVEICGGTLTSFGLTFMDRLQEEQLVATAYDIPNLGDLDDDLFEWYTGPNRVGMVTDILPGGGDLEHQQRVTDRLFTAEPRLSSLPGDEYPSWFADQLGLPLRMASYGPSYDKKVWFNA